MCFQQHFPCFHITFRVNFKFVISPEKESVFEGQCIFYLLLSDNAENQTSAVTAAVIFGDCSDDRRAATRAAVFNDLLCERDSERTAVFFGRTPAQIAFLYGVDQPFINDFGSYAR